MAAHLNIIRVFPRCIPSATPNDPMAFYDVPGMFLPPCDEVHVSVAFTWDRGRAEYLAGQWEHVAPVKIGGPGWNNEPGANFVPGRYLRHGYVITSRGCPNRCWFCSVWKREPGLRELPITDGWIVQDDNLLACSERHVRDVFSMLSRQRRRAHLRGLEAKLLLPWHIDLMRGIHPAALWFACDDVADFEPLEQAGNRLLEAGFTRNQLYCYCLIGHPRDNFADAEHRLRRVFQIGFMPFAMLWRDEDGENSRDWRSFQRIWSRPAIIKSRNKDLCAAN